MRPYLTSAITALATAILTSALALPLRAYLSPVNLAMFYLLAVATVAARRDRLTTILTTTLSIAALDYFCIPPYGTLAVAESENLLTFAALLVVGLLINTLTSRLRAQAHDAEAREARTRALHQLSETLAGETRVFEVAQSAAALAQAALDATVVLFLPEQGSLTFRRRTSQDLPMPASEETVAAWTFKHGRKAGLGVDALLPAQALYIPLRGTRGVLGVMAVKPAAAPLPPEHDILADLFAHQIALAIERTQSHNAAETSRLQIHTEQMRSSLLSAVSHDLRTPLAAISGAASTLRESAERLSTETRADLLDSITTESERLSRLVSNLLDMTRFESGVTLHREPCPLEDIAGVAFRRLETQLRHRTVTAHFPPDLPPLFVDEVLLGQAFLNILENAAKYTPTGSPIELSARQEGETVSIEIRDHGPGLVPGEESRLFDKFYRSREARVSGTAPTGAGLGLAIAKAVIEAHGGRIEAYNHRQGGAVFHLSLPLLHLEQPA